MQPIPEICAGAHEICIRVSFASPFGGDQSRMSAAKLACYQVKTTTGGIHLQSAPCGYVSFTHADAKPQSDERAVVGSIDVSFLRRNRTSVRRTTMLSKLRDPTQITSRRRVCRPHVKYS